MRHRFAKSLFSLFIAVAMFFSMVPLALAEDVNEADAVAEVLTSNGTTETHVGYYTTLEDALTAAQGLAYSSDVSIRVIRLLKQASLRADYNFNVADTSSSKRWTYRLDLNGNNLTGEGKKLTIKGAKSRTGTLNIVNSNPQNNICSIDIYVARYSTSVKGPTVYLYAAATYQGTITNASMKSLSIGKTGEKPIIIEKKIVTQNSGSKLSINSSTKFKASVSDGDGYYTQNDVPAISGYKVVEENGYYVYQRCPVKITLNPEGGSFSSDWIPVDGNAEAAVTLENLNGSSSFIIPASNNSGITRSNYIFKGWYTAENGVGTLVVPSSGSSLTANDQKTYSTFNSADDCYEMTLYAYWLPIAATLETASGNIYEYDSVPEAFEAANKGSGIIHLQANWNLKTSPLALAYQQTPTLDLNGYTVTATNTATADQGCLFIPAGSKLTLTDSSGGKTGKICCATSQTVDPNNPYAAVNVYGSFVMESGMIDATEAGNYAIGVYNEGKATINGGTVQAANFAIAGNGSNTGSNTKITVAGGTITSANDYAIYHPQNGLLTITGGSVSGAAGGIAMNAGNMEMTGGNVTSEGTATIGGTGSGTSGFSNAAINVNAGYADSSAVISGGNVAASGNASILAKGTDTGHTATITVTGGTYSADPGTYVSEGCSVSTADGKWTVSKQKYTVTFISDEETVDVQTVSWGDSVSAPSIAAKTGYTLDSWYNGETKFAFETAVIKGNTTLTAKWTANTPTVTFNANGGTVNLENKQVTYDAAYDELPTPEKTGYTFDGWFTNADAGSQVTASTIVSNPEGHTLYARWTANSYTVRFDSKGGSACADIPATYDADVTLPAPSKSGYNFNGWNTAEDGSGTSYQGTTSNLASANGAVVTLYAQWTDKAVVTYDNAVPQFTTYDGSAKAYVLPAHDLTGFAISYKQAEETVAEPTNAGSYDVVITRPEDVTNAAFSKTITGGLVIEKATGSISITPSISKLSGGGKVTLTVTSTGLPTDAVIAVTCNNNIVVADDFTASLPNSSVTYAFTATYTDQTGNYENASATCTVEVSRVSSSSGSSSGSNTSTTTEKNPDGSTTTTTTNKTTGTVTEVTKDTDGTTTTVETKKDGTVTETVKTPEGTTGTVVTDKNGDITEAKATVSSTAVKEAAKTGEAVTLPMEVPTSISTKDAPAVQVTVPESVDSVKVEIPVEKVTPGTVAVIVKADGTEQIISTSVVTENGVAFTLDGNATVKVIDNSKDFIDVPETNVFYNEVSSLSAREIMVGKTDDVFDLHNSVSLNQVANVAGRITGAVDVHDFNAGIVWGNENGLKTGDEAATRGEVLKALYVAAGSPVVEDTSILNIFNDGASIPADMAAITAWAAKNGILKGDLAGMANLSAKVTRGQACALASRAMSVIA